MTDILFTANGASATVQVNGELTSGMVGVPVRFAFDSDWDGLNIVVVFDGSGRRISVPLLTGYQGVLPWEVIAKANTRLHIGAEGRKSDGSIVIPTVWANAGYIREGAAATDDEGNPPTPGIYDQIMAAIEAGKLQGKPGEDGVSPTVSVTEIEGGHRVTITDANGTQVFDVMDGSGFDIKIADDLDTKDPNIALSANMGTVLREKIDTDLLTVQKELQAEINQRVKTVNGITPDENGNVVVEIPEGGSGGSGEPGADGFSPVANVTQTASGAVISITDKSGTTTASVVNGKDGKDGYTPVKGVDYFDGAPGADGYTPVKGKDYFDGQPGKDGSDGKDGYTPQKGVDYFDGQPGSNGKDGVSATHSWNGTTLTITSASGTSSANLKGDKGDTGSGGSPGADGVSPTVAVSKSGKVTTVSITDKNGTKTATINDGADGSPGSAGKDGTSVTHSWNGTTLTVTSASGTSSANLKGDKGDTGETGASGTSVTVKSVSESTADGGSNVVTFSDGKTVTIKNGSKGSTGSKGDTGAAGVSVSSVKQTTTSNADGGSNVVTVTLSNGTTSTFTVKNGSKGSTGATGATGSKGADGYTPVRGTDYWTEADKVEIVQRVIETLGGSPIFGIVDEDNNIIVNGDLPDGTYSVKYETEDGKTISIGNLVLDSNVYYTVTNTLTQCTTSNSATKAVQGGSYSATISANSGYELSSVKVTMGGTDISSSAVSGGTITISNVTGNIVITAVAEEIKAAYTNLADPTSSDWLENTRISSSGFPTQSGITTSNWIAVTNGDVVRIKGIDVNTHQYARVALFSSSKSLLSSAKVSGLASADATGVTYDTTGAQFTIASTNAKFIRICGELNGAASDVIITKNEPIE